MTGRAVAACVLAGCGGGATPLDPGTGGVLVLGYEYWEEARGCWAPWSAERPSDQWSLFEPECATTHPSEPEYRYFANGEGQCMRLPDQLFTPGCAPTDPWLGPCSGLPGCCDHAREEPACGSDTGATN